MLKLLIVLILFLIIILPLIPQSTTYITIHKIEPKEFVEHLNYLKLFLKNTKDSLNKFLQDEAENEELVKLLERTEFQIDKINNLLTHYGDI